jgi:hypothetical protein
VAKTLERIADTGPPEAVLAGADPANRTRCDDAVTDYDFEWSTEMSFDAWT